ncbi:D-glycerate dehydrogenase [Bacillus sp. OK048]|uniref:2-hydroxyacid dehydrogenase n=1 Tax=Bacillus sp. OK048 TaxID=1882761 RepID=UPI00088CD60D|nr:D-glycerate dehydrogenase [Bacillus sp. OK048]SDN71138.1 glyoxylate reductase [Bacillus sp. OK048]
MEKPNVVVIGKLPELVLARLEQKAKLKVWDRPERIPQDMLTQWLKDVEGFISRGDIQVNDQLLLQAPHLRVIAQSSVGYDNVDMEACTKRSIPFGNTPEVLNNATADLTFGLLLSAARRIPEGSQFVKSGKWKSPFDVPMGVDLFEKTLGIVGMGNIGRGVAKRAQASGMNVIYHNRRENNENDKLNATYVSFEQLLEKSDFIVVLVPLTSHTRGLFGKEEFTKMKSSAYFINASRGPVVNTNALYEALKEEQIAYASLDVTDPEPINMDHPIMSLDNVLITPHIGSATIETRTKMANLTVDNILAGLENKPLPTCVNEKELNGLQTQTRRI